MESKWTVLGLIILAHPVVAEMNGGGSLQGRVGESYENSFFAKGDLTLFGNWYDAKNRFSIKIDTHAIYGLGSLDANDFRVNKALISWNVTSNWEIFLGRTTEIWGRLDELSALDFPFAEDLRWKYWETPSSRKLARTVIGQEVYWGNQTISLLLFPKSQDHSQANLDSGWCDQSCQWNQFETQTAFFQNQGFSVTTAPKDEANAEGAVRWTGLMGDTDFGWTAYYGSDHWSRISRQLQPNQTVTLRSANFQSWSTGLDGAKTFGDWVIRGELAYRDKVAIPFEPSSNVYAIDNDGFAERSVVSVASALETMWMDGVRTNIQVLYSAVQGTDTNLVLPGEINAATAFIEKTFYENNITLQSRFIYDFDHSGYHNRSKLAWSPQQGSEIALEISVFKGNDKLRNYGYLAQNNGIFVTLLNEF